MEDLIAEIELAYLLFKGLWTHLILIWLVRYYCLLNQNRPVNLVEITIIIDDGNNRSVSVGASPIRYGFIWNPSSSNFWPKPYAPRWRPIIVWSFSVKAPNVKKISYWPYLFGLEVYKVSESGQNIDVYGNAFISCASYKINFPELVRHPLVDHIGRKGCAHALNWTRNRRRN